MNDDRPIPDRPHSNPATGRHSVSRMIIALGMCFVSLAWLMPGHYFPWLTFQQEFMAAAAVSIVGLGAWVSDRGAVRWPVLAVVALAASLVPLAQFASGQVRFVADAILAAAYLTGFAMSVVLGATLINDKRGLLLDGLTTAFVAAALASTYIELMQWLQLPHGIWTDGMPPGGRPYANLGQPNNLATLLILGAVGLLRWYETRRISGAAATFGLVHLGWGIVLTQSRTAWLLVALLPLWVMFSRRRTHMCVALPAVLCGVGLFAVAVLVRPTISDALLLSDGGPLAGRLHSGYRWVHWQTMWDAVWRSPWVGYGWTQASFGQLAAALDHPPTGEALTNSHNLFLDLLIWNGVPIGCGLIGTLIWWFIHHLHASRSPERAWLLAAVGAVFVHAMAEFPLDYAFFLFPVGLMMGALDGLDGPSRLWLWPRASLAVPWLMVSALIVWVGLEYAKVDAAARTLRFVVQGIGVDKVPVAPPPNVSLLDRPRELHRFMLSRAEEGMSSDDIQAARDIVYRHPYAASLLHYGVILGLNGRPSEATRALELLCKVHPAERCFDAWSAWHEKVDRYPVLRKIAFPRPGTASEPSLHQ